MHDQMLRVACTLLDLDALACPEAQVTRRIARRVVSAAKDAPPSEYGLAMRNLAAASLRLFADNGPDVRAEWVAARAELDQHWPLVGA
ncbi:hypothetical protein [Candidatus Mycobacterium methanotrophicum]|uniref:Uncharacterized protein n=1 Tax=Candidatus Mycobacterium methanotrophicum TaxID=2943498 RepID=A0ABY4QMZ4_9MYCO|nr:hypothetical protein [Candidatus Mycobacterium methanotrophicum]UQX11326.1 hypothetical protein M5I08_01945 [Candidatus Mycobacterium methanotrophicum]